MSRLNAAWRALPPSVPYLASALSPAGWSAFSASRRPPSAANGRGFLPSLSGASMDVKEPEKEAEEGSRCGDGGGAAVEPSIMAIADGGGRWSGSCGRRREDFPHRGRRRETGGKGDAGFALDRKSVV